MGRRGRGLGVLIPTGRRRGWGSRGRSAGVVKPAGKRRYRGRGLGALSPAGKRRGTKGWKLWCPDPPEPAL